MIEQPGDDKLVPLFKNQATENKARSNAEGRPIFDDLEVVEIRRAGSRDFGVYPAQQMSHWSSDMYSGEQRPVTYAERFRRQYNQFKEHQQQTKSGTLLDHAGFLTEGKRAELRAQNIYTVEMLAAIEGTELKNLGPGGRELKNKAEEYIAAGKTRVPDIQLRAEVEAMRAKMQVLEEDNALLKHKQQSGEAGFEAMSLEQLREYITVNSGNPPVGALNKRGLVRLAMEIPVAQTKV